MLSIARLKKTEINAKAAEYQQVTLINSDRIDEDDLIREYLSEHPGVHADSVHFVILNI